MNKQIDNKELEIRKKRLVYRASHRGTQEMDILLGGFVRANIANYDAEQIEKLENFINEQDGELLKWILQQEAVPEHIDSGLIEQIRYFHTNKKNNNG